MLHVEMCHMFCTPLLKVPDPSIIEPNALLWACHLSFQAAFASPAQRLQARLVACSLLHWHLQGFLLGIKCSLALSRASQSAAYCCSLLTHSLPICSQEDPGAGPALNKQRLTRLRLFCRERKRLRGVGWRSVTLCRVGCANAPAGLCCPPPPPFC